MRRIFFRASRLTTISGRQRAEYRCLAAVAQIYAILALAAATALGTTAADGRA